MKYVKTADASGEAELWSAYRASPSPEGRNALVERYLHLLTKPVMRIYPVCRNANELGDIYQSAALGLISAVENYAPNSETSFKTFSYRRIHGSIIDYLRKSSLINVPYYVRKKAAEVGALSDTADVIPNIISLDELAGDEHRSDYLANMLVDLSASVEDSVTDRMMAEKALRLLNELPVDEYAVLVLYYFKNRTLNEIAQRLSLSRTGVWQMRGRAVTRLRGMM